MIDNDIPHTYFCPEVLVSRPGDWDDMISMPTYSSSHYEDKSLTNGGQIRRATFSQRRKRNIAQRKI